MIQEDKSSLAQKDTCAPKMYVSVSAVLSGT